MAENSLSGSSPPGHDTAATNQPTHLTMHFRTGVMLSAPEPPTSLLAAEVAESLLFPALPTHRDPAGKLGTPKRKRRLRRLAHLCALLLLLFPSLTLHAADRSASANTSARIGLQYTRRLWHVQDGLPEETAQALQQTPDGYLWVGTTGGLARFDGTRFVTWSRSTEPQLPDDSVFSLLSARDGTLWIGTEGGGLLAETHGSFRSYGKALGAAGSFVRSVIQDHTGRIWVGTDNGLFEQQGDRFLLVNTSSITPAFAVHAVYEDQEGRIWAGGARLLLLRMVDGGVRMRQFRLPGAYSRNRVKTILQSRDGTIWVGTVSGLLRLRNGRFQTVPGISGTVRTLRQTIDGTLWIGTIGHGLYTLHDEHLQRLSGNGLLPSNTVLSILQDHAGQIWIGTQDGLVRLRDTPVGVVPLPGGSDPDFATVAADTGATIWAVSSRVYAIRGGSATPVRFPAIGSAQVRDLFRARDGSLWIGTDGSGVFRISHGGVEHFSAPQTLTNNFVRAFLQSRDGSLWVGTDEGLNHITGRHVRQFRPSDGLAFFSIRSLLEDHHGLLWIGTEQGLSCWNGSRFVPDPATRALRQEKIWSILEDKAGVLWFGTRDDGLFRYRDGELHHFTVAEGLGSNSIYQLLEDHLAQLWISSPDSISSVPLESLESAGSGAPTHLSVTTYEMPYNAAGAQFYGGRQPSGCVGQDGSLWFPSNKGAIHILPVRAPLPAAPRLLLTSISVDGRTVAPPSFHTVSADGSRLEFAYAPFSLRSQAETRFRYRLEPFDRTWTYAGNTRTATYTNLPAGRYRFRVEAFPLNNPAAVSQASISFRKQPHFYRTWWFLLGALLLFALTTLGIYRWRMRLLQGRFQAVLDERSRLAREMHDTLIQGCTSTSALLEAAASMEPAPDAPQGELLSFARTQLRTTINEAREAVWNLRHGDEPNGDLAAAATLFAEHTRREFGVAVECNTAGTAYPVPSSTAHELSMVIREAVYNAVLHGRPAHIVIHLSYRAEALAVEVEDDGCGFAPASVLAQDALHYGVRGMRERIERLHGTIEWTSAPNRGTLVAFHVRRSALSPSKQELAL